MFSDGVYGAKYKSLAAAIKWRDRTLKKLPHPLRIDRGSIKRPYGYTKRVLLKRRVDWHDVYTAWARLKSGKVATTSYSIAKYGKKEAKRLADIWLQSKLS